VQRGKGARGKTAKLGKVLKKKTKNRTKRNRPGGELWGEDCNPKKSRRDIRGGKGFGVSLWAKRRKQVFIPKVKKKKERSFSQEDGEKTGEPFRQKRGKYGPSVAQEKKDISG